jgi:hypothetical protein
MRRVIALVVTTGLVSVGAGTQPSTAAEPRLRVPQADLAAALRCQPDVRRARRPIVLLVTGTGVTGTEAWRGAPQRILARAGHLSCYVNFPAFTTGDMQIASEYLVYAVRRMARLSGRAIGVYGVSQGAMLPVWALKHWPSLRTLVTDVVGVAGAHRGTPVFSRAACQPGCPPVIWQVLTDSVFMKAYARGDETPGPTDWTTVRSATDELALPTGGPDATSVLPGASNLVIQSICPGRSPNHIESGSDSVSFALLLDALAHRGPARARRIPSAVCSRLFAGGADPVAVRKQVGREYELAATRLLGGVPTVKREPPLKRYARSAHEARDPGAIARERD